MSTASASLPTLSQVQNVDTAYLREAAAYWTHSAELWETTFTQIHHQMSTPAGTSWQGHAADKALERTYHDMVQVRGASDQLRRAAAAVRRGAEQLQTCKDGVLAAVRDAGIDDFITREDYSVTDRARGGSAAYWAARQEQAEEHAALIRHRVAALVATDHQITAEVAATTKGIDDLRFDESERGGADRGRVQAVDHTWKLDPTPTPQPEPSAGPSADDIRKVLEKLPEGTDTQVREVRSPEDLERLWRWLERAGIPQPGAYGSDPAKGIWKDLPNGIGVGRRNSCGSNGEPAIDIKIPGEKGSWKVHINPRGGALPELPAPIAPEPPQAPPARTPAEPPPAARAPVEPEPGRAGSEPPVRGAGPGIASAEGPGYRIGGGQGRFPLLAPEAELPK